AVRLLLRGGQDHDRQEVSRRCRADLREHLEPIDLRQLEVEQDDRRLHWSPRRMGTAAEKPVERLRAVTHNDDRVMDVVLRERADSEYLVVDAVFDEEDWPWLIHPRHPTPVLDRTTTLGVSSCDRLGILTYGRVAYPTGHWTGKKPGARPHARLRERTSDRGLERRATPHPRPPPHRPPDVRA